MTIGVKWGTGSWLSTVLQALWPSSTAEAVLRFPATDHQPPRHWPNGKRFKANSPIESLLTERREDRREVDLALARIEVAAHVIRPDELAIIILDVHVADAPLVPQPGSGKRLFRLIVERQELGIERDETACVALQGLADDRQRVGD